MKLEATTMDQTLELYPPIPVLKAPPREDAERGRGAGFAPPLPAAGGASGALLKVAALGAALIAGGTTLSLYGTRARREAARSADSAAVQSYFGEAGAAQASGLPRPRPSGRDTTRFVRTEELKDAPAALPSASGAGALTLRGGEEAGAEADADSRNAFPGEDWKPLVVREPEAVLEDAAAAAKAQGAGRGAGFNGLPSGFAGLGGRQAAAAIGAGSASGASARQGLLGGLDTLAGGFDGRGSSSAGARERFGRSGRMGSPRGSAPGRRHAARRGAAAGTKARLMQMQSAMAALQTGGSFTGDSVQGSTDELQRAAQTHTDQWSSGDSSKGGTGAVRLGGMRTTPSAQAEAQAAATTDALDGKPLVGDEEDGERTNAQAPAPPPVGKSKDKTPHKDLIEIAKALLLTASILLSMATAADLAAKALGPTGYGYAAFKLIAEICAVAALIVCVAVVAVGIAVALYSDPLQGAIFSVVGVVLGALAYLALADASSLPDAKEAGVQAAVKAAPKLY